MDICVCYFLMRDALPTQLAPISRIQKGEKCVPNVQFQELGLTHKKARIVMRIIKGIVLTMFSTFNKLSCNFPTFYQCL